MKLKKVWPAVVLTLLMSSTPLLGQTLEIRKVDFAAIENAGYAKLQALAYRVKATYDNDWNTDGSDRMISVVTYHKPPDRRRSIIQWKTSKGIKQTETIEVGKRKFSRENDGPWSEEKDQDRDRYSMFGDPVDAKETLTYLYLGPEVVSGISTKLYERRTLREYKIKNGVFISDYIERLWIAADGRFIKRGSTSITTQNGEKQTSHTVSEYDYDSRIKIDVPIR